MVIDGDTVRRLISARSGEAAPQPPLAPTADALALLGDPHRAAPMVHITGTNGKTSTARMTESLLRSAGLRTGLFTSPHLVLLNERIVIDGVPIEDDALIASWHRVAPAIAAVDARLIATHQPPMTTFETLTVLGFDAFASAGVEVQVVEVGMGGEWDSTNVADAAVAVFTPIDLDHTAILGRSIVEIARTKSGIVKRGSAVVSAEQHAAAAAVLRAAAARAGTVVEFCGGTFGVERRTATPVGQRLDLRGPSGSFPSIELPLLGAFQAENAALAVAAADRLLGRVGRRLDASTVRRGLAAAASPGRLEVVDGDPRIIVDAAHNPHGVRAALRAVREYAPARRVVAVLALLADKDAAGVLAEAADGADDVVLTTAPSPRAAAAHDLAATMHRVRPDAAFAVEPDPRDALVVAVRTACADQRQAVVVLLGSVTLAGAAPELIRAVAHAH